MKILKIIKKVAEIVVYVATAILTGQIFMS
jgi:hypothetical protein